MSIKWKIAIMVGVPVIALVAMVWFGWQTMGKMLRDFPRLTELEESMKMMLEADRDVHRAVIAEKMVLVAEQAEMPAARETHEKNIQSALDRIGMASLNFDTEKAKNLYIRFRKDFVEWQIRTHEVVEMAEMQERLEFARKSSDDGSAHRAFNRLVASLSLLEEAQRTAVHNAAAAMQESSARMAALFSGIGAFASVIALLGALYLAAKIVRPVYLAMILADRVRQGDLSRRLSLDTNDEIGQLADALDAMADGLAAKAQLANSIASGDLSREVSMSSEADEFGRALRAMTVSLRGDGGGIPLEVTIQDQAVLREASYNVKPMKTPTIDGQFGDWPRQEKMVIDADSRTIVSAANYAGNQDMTARVHAGWSSAGLHLAFRVDDDAIAENGAGGTVLVDDQGQAEQLGLEGFGDEPCQPEENSRENIEATAVLE